MLFNDQATNFNLKSKYFPLLKKQVDQQIKQEQFHLQETQEKSAKFNQTQRKNKNSSINYLKIPQFQIQYNEEEDSPRFNKNQDLTLKNKTLSKINTLRRTDLRQNSQNKECKKIHGTRDALYRLQLQHESLLRKYNLIKKQLDIYKGKSYQKTEKYMKLLQEQTKAELNKYAYIQLLNVKMIENEKINSQKMKKHNQMHQMQISCQKQKNNEMKSELSNNISQIESLETLNYEIEFKYQKLKEFSKQKEQQSKIRMQSLLTQIKELQFQINQKNTQNLQLEAQYEKLKQDKKEMEGQIHVLLAIQAKKSQQIKQNLKKIKQFQHKLQIMNEKNIQTQKILNEKQKEIQVKKDQIQMLKQKQSCLIRKQIQSRQKYQFAIQKKNKQIESFTHQNERLYKDVNRFKLIINQLSIKYNVKQDFFQI